MRIRKHAKVSPLLYTSSTPPENGVVLQSSTICQLNQSPWDVITFSPEEYSFPAPPTPPPPPPPPLHHHQVEVEDIILGNGSFCDSIGASESEEAPMKLSIDDDEVAAEDMNEDEKFCEKIDDKGWQCHRVAKSGHTLCEHHSRRGRPKKGSASTYPNGYYYYSGFGPRWGKRRGPNNHSSAIEEPRTTDAPILTSASGERESDYMEEEEEDDEEEEDGGNGKKRARKPIKARSLKSLM